MNEWLISVTATIFLSTLATMLIPEGKTSKLIKSFFSLLTVLVIIKPLANLNANYTFKLSTETNSEIVIQEDYLHSITETNVNNKKKLFLDELVKSGINDAKIEVFYAFDEKFNLLIKEIKVNLINAVINTDKEHNVIMREVKELCCEIFLVGEEVVIIYG